ARFVLAHPDPQAAPVRAARSLALPAEDRAVRRIAAQTHPDLLVLERIINEKTGKLYTVIRVEDVRRTVPFFGSTAGEGGWRVCILDSAGQFPGPLPAHAPLPDLYAPPPHPLPPL